MQYNTIIFDLDGTLTDSAPGIMNSIAYALQKGGYAPFSAAQLRSCIGPPLAEQFQLILGVSEAESQRLLGLYREYFAVKGIYENALYPGIKQLMERLYKSNVCLMLCTGKPEHFARVILENFEIAQYFTDVLGPTLDGKYLDKAEGLKALLERNNNLGQLLFVGDRKFDILAAKGSAMESAGVLWGYGTREELASYGADYILTSVAQLADMLNA